MLSLGIPFLIFPNFFLGGEEFNVGENWSFIPPPSLSVAVDDCGILLPDKKIGGGGISHVYSPPPSLMTVHIGLLLRIYAITSFAYYLFSFPPNFPMT